MFGFSYVWNKRDTFVIVYVFRQNVKYVQWAVGTVSTVSTVYNREGKLTKYMTLKWLIIYSVYHLQLI